jgi:branched-subunit amino acid aminotransferase/4-amino-4-deoxychorismate lyase
MSAACEDDATAEQCTAANAECLPGLARLAVLAACEAEGIAVEERAPEAFAREAWTEAGAYTRLLSGSM